MTTMVVMVVNMYDGRLKVIHGPNAHIVPAYTIQWVPLIVVGPLDDTVDVEFMVDNWKRPSQILDICKRLNIAPPIQIRAQIPPKDPTGAAGGDDTIENIRIRKK